MSVLVDTSVVSELMRKFPAPAVVAWAAGHPVERLFLPVIAEAELRYGAAILPSGRRRDTLVSDIENMLRAAFDNRILPFDSDAARAYAGIAARRRAVGRSTSPADCQVAAIAAARGMAVATRNVGGFDDMGIDMIDPWQET